MFVHHVADMFAPIHIYKLGSSLRLVPAFVVLAKLGFVFPDSMWKVLEWFLRDESKRGAGLQDEHISAFSNQLSRSLIWQI